MSQTRIELNLQGINEIMKSSEIKTVLSGAANDVAARAGNGYAARVHDANWVSIANVYADTPAAVKDNLKNNTLFKAVG